MTRASRVDVWTEPEWVQPVKWLPTPDYVNRYAARWRTVHGAAPNVRKPPMARGAATADLAGRLDSVFPDLGVLELKRPLVYSAAGWVRSRQGYWLPDHSWYGRYIDEMWLPDPLPRARRLPGVALSLCSDFAPRNYGHFLLDVLPRLHLFAEAGIATREVDHVIVPKPPSANAREMFASLGIAAAKCVWAEDGLAVRPDTLLVSSFPGTRRNYPAWVPQFLKDTFGVAVESRERRLFVSRCGETRNAVNEDAIHRIAADRGFEIYDAARQPCSVRDFAEAAIVAGPHGAGLADLAFCAARTQVLELIPSDHVYPYYYTLAEAAGLEYSYLLCRSTHERPAGAWGPSESDFVANEVEVARALDALIAARERTSACVKSLR